MATRRYETVLGEIFSKYQEKEIFRESVIRCEKENHAQERLLNALQVRKCNIIKEATREINKEIHEKGKDVDSVRNKLVKAREAYHGKMSEYDSYVGKLSKKFSSLSKFKPKMNPLAKRNYGKDKS